MSKILFIYPDIQESREKYSQAVAKQDYEGMFYTGIASISAVLKQHGHETELFHIIKPIEEYLGIYNILDKRGCSLYGVLNLYQPDIIAFSCTTNQFPIVRDIALSLNEHWKNKSFVICGGVHAILNPKEVINTKGIDAVCTGEGEFVMLDLANNLSAGDIFGIWYKNNIGIVIKNETRYLIQNIDALPFPDRELFDYENTYGGKMGRADMVVSRGCPYSCTYCCNHAIREKTEGKYFRMHSPEYVVQECKEVLKYYTKTKYFDFRDDCFTMDREWTMKFIELYKKEINLPIVIISRADRLDEPMIKALSEVPCNMIRIGVESGSERILETMGRKVTPEIIKYTAELCARYKIKIYPFYMVGLPQETPGDFFETIRLHGDLVKTGAVEMNTYHLAIFYPYPGTRLFNYCKENNLISKRTESTYFTDSILNLPQFPREDIVFLKDNFSILAKAYLIRKGVYL